MIKEKAMKILKVKYELIIASYAYHHIFKGMTTEASPNREFTLVMNESWPDLHQNVIQIFGQIYHNRMEPIPLDSELSKTRVEDEKESSEASAGPGPGAPRVYEVSVMQNKAMELRRKLSLAVGETPVTEARKKDPITIITEQFYDQAKLRATLSSMSVGGEVMFALSGMHALNMLSFINEKEEQIKFCILYDFSDSSEFFWPKAFEVFKRSNSSREAYHGLLSLLQELLHINAELYGNEENLMNLMLQKLRFEIEVKSGLNCLSSEVRFRTIKNLADRMVFVRLNTADSNQIGAVINTLDQLQLQLGVIYTGNVREYCEATPGLSLDGYQHCLGLLAKASHPNGIVLDTEPRRGGKNLHSNKIARIYPLRTRVLTLKEISQKTVRVCFPTSPPMDNNRKIDPDVQTRSALREQESELFLKFIGDELSIFDPLLPPEMFKTGSAGPSVDRKE